MADKEQISRRRGQGQAKRLSEQHVRGGGVVGIFGADAKRHDASVRQVTEQILLLLKTEFPGLEFRLRTSIRKEEIHGKLRRVDPRLGTKLFAPTASIQPDGGVLEVQDRRGAWRVVLVGECKHQGNDISNIAGGIRTTVMEVKGQYIMPAGNAIERVHKNIQEIRNFMLGESHFPFVVLLQGSNFATEPVLAKWPDGKEIPLLPSDSGVNRIDRVTAANFGMEINRDHSKNLVVGKQRTMLQAASIYAQCEQFTNIQMLDILWNTAITSLEVLAAELPASSGAGSSAKTGKPGKKT